MADENVEGVDVHYAYFRSIVNHLGDTSVGNKVKGVYDYAKTTSPYVQKTLDGVENKVVTVNGHLIAPIYANYFYPTADRLAHASQSGIDKGKHVYLGAKDLAQATTALGLGVAVVGAQVSLIISSTLTNLLLDGVILTKDLGSGIIIKTRSIEQSVESTIFSTLENCRGLAGVPINKAAEYTNSLLDVMNAFLDNFLHLPVDESESVDSSIPERVKTMAKRVGQAIVTRTVEPCQRQLTNLSESLRQKLNLVDVVKKHGGNVKEQVLNTSLSGLYTKLEHEAHEMKVDPGVVLLKSIQNCSKTLNLKLKAIREKSAQTLPAAMADRLDGVVGYIENLDKTFGNATSIHAIKDEVIEEAKHRISDVVDIEKFFSKLKNGQTPPSTPNSPKEESQPTPPEGKPAQNGKEKKGGHKKVPTPKKNVKVEPVVENDVQQGN